MINTSVTNFYVKKEKQNFIIFFIKTHCLNFMCIMLPTNNLSPNPNLNLAPPSILYQVCLALIDGPPLTTLVHDISKP